MNLLITGVSGKLGQVMARAALESGYTVYGTYLSQVPDLNSYPKFSAIQWDMLQPNSANTLLRQLSDLTDQLDIVVHNARSLAGLQLSEDGWADDTVFIKELQMAVTVPYQVTRALVESRLQPKQIIFINSIYGKVVPNLSIYESSRLAPPPQYGVAKGAQLKLAQELAVRLAPQGIRVNSLIFGGVSGRAPMDFSLRYNQLTPAGGMLQEEDVSSAFMAAINPQLSMVTGNEWHCDGGWTLW